MKTFPSTPSTRGFSLIEAIVSVGVLALAIPLVLGALVESGNSGTSASAETRSGWMVPTCLDELKAAADGKSSVFPATRSAPRFRQQAHCSASPSTPAASRSERWTRRLTRAA